MDSLLWNDNKFVLKVIFLFIGILFFFTQLTKVNLGHLLAIAFTISLVLIYIQSNLDTNQGLLTK